MRGSNLYLVRIAANLLVTEKPVIKNDGPFQLFTYPTPWGGNLRARFSLNGRRMMMDDG